MTFAPRIRSLGYRCKREHDTIMVVPRSSGLVIFACLAVVCVVVPAIAIWLATRNPWFFAGALSVGFLPALTILQWLRKEARNGPAWVVDLNRGELTVGGPPEAKIVVADICEWNVKKEWHPIPGDSPQCVYTVYVVLGSSKDSESYPIATFLDWNVANHCASRTAELLGVRFQPL